ncbi:MAG: hypothetical protein Q9224_007127 [Gallowayella concinna]
MTSTSIPASFTPEGGKFRLAETLFNIHKFSIPCPSCPTVQGKPGFIKDQAGKSGKDGLNRRMWKCQRSNIKHARTSCSRITCTEYIDLARRSLSGDCFSTVIQAILREDLPSVESQLIRSYIDSPVIIPNSQPASSFTLTYAASTISFSTIPSDLPSLPDTARCGQKRPAQRALEGGLLKRERLDSGLTGWPDALDILQKSVSQAIELTVQRWAEAVDPLLITLSDGTPSTQVFSSVSLNHSKDISALAGEFQETITAEDRARIRQQVKSLDGKREFEAQLKKQRHNQHPSVNLKKS